MIVGVAAEPNAAERRVALVPRSVRDLSAAGLDVVVERGAGVHAGFADGPYEAEGARLAADAAEVVAAADLVACVGTPPASLRSGQIVVGLLDPFGSPATIRRLAEAGVTSFALELLPRITRAQAMDALSAMATISGYKAVLLAAAELGKMFPMMITAAGTLAPAKVFVVGAGVAGLQAIATARRLGAVVTGYDIRPAVREQVQSLGAAFLEIELDTDEAGDAGGYARQMNEEFYGRQRELMAAAVAQHDVVVTTAAVPGKRAPVLITEEMVRGMAGASVIVDLAAETGGNCALTRPGATIDVHDVRILGPVNLASTVPHHASQMYSKNVASFVVNLARDGVLDVDRDDEIIRDTMVTREGGVTSPRLREAMATAPGAAAAPARGAGAPQRSGS